MVKESGRRITPRFLAEGYALYEGGDYYIAILDNGETLKSTKKKRGYDFIGVKPDAPRWAKEEYEEWISANRNI